MRSYRPSAATRALWSAQRKGKGRPHTAETKAKLSEARRDPDRRELFARGLQRCGRCREVKPLGEFYSNSRNDSGYNYRCISCVRANERKPDSRKKFAALVRSYGITVEDWARAFHTQRGLCAVCAVHLNDKIANGLHTDHCHVTGRFRALLCGGCNLAAGALRDDPATAEALAEYLRKFSPNKKAPQ